jgi:hypothetical protein
MAISLKRFATSPNDLADTANTWVLKVEATSTTTGLSSAIFKYHFSGTDDPYEGDTYEGVCNVPDMGELPIDAPRYENNEIIVPYYRKNTVVLYCRNPEQEQDEWDKIVEYAQQLLDNFTAAQDLMEIETVTLQPSE